MYDTYLQCHDNHIILLYMHYTTHAVDTLLFSVRLVSWLGGYKNPCQYRMLFVQLADWNSIEFDRIGMGRGGECLTSIIMHINAYKYNKIVSLQVQSLEDVDYHQPLHEHLGFMS